MAGRRHHTIPQFILRGFASGLRGNEVNVWLYRRNAEAIELNIKNVGVEKDFYGEELDARITELETRYAALVKQLRGETGPVKDRQVGEMVAHMTLRTRSVRQSAIELAATMTDGIREHLSRPDVLKAAARRRYTKRELLDRLREELAKNGLSRVEIEKRVLSAGPQVLVVLQRKLDEFAEDAAAVVSESMRDGVKGLPTSMRTHFIEAFSRGLESNPRIEGYTRYDWFVVPVAGRLLLGDSICVFETVGRRRFKPLDDETDPGKRVLMPLATDRLLIGTNDSEPPVVSEAEVNEASVRCSLEFFVSANRLSDAEAHLVDSIGAWSGIASDEEQRAMLDEIKRDYPPVTG